MTLKDIANEAGVSVSTVSRVVNKSSENAASKEVQDRIWDIVKKTGYTPNSNARNLKKGTIESQSEFHSIACLFARTDNATSDLFFSKISRSIEQEAFKHNYVLKYSFTAIDIHHPNTLNLITNNHVDGVVVLGRCNKQTLRFLKEYFNCVAYAGLNTLDAKYDQIISDGYQAGITAVNYLLNMGHTEIGYLGETENENRYIGYKDAISDRGITLKKDHIANISLSMEGGYQGARLLLEKNPRLSALFCCNDITAIGAMKAIKESGRSIPEDISIISIDDIETAQYVTPMLTTIHIPTEEMGQMTAKTLIDRIEGGHHLPMRINLPFHMAIRESCMPFKKR